MTASTEFEFRAEPGSFDVQMGAVAVAVGLDASASFNAAQQVYTWSPTAAEFVFYASPQKTVHWGAQGSLAALLSARVPAAAALAGAGVMDAQLSQRVAVGAALGGGGSLTAQMQPVYAVAAPFSGAGAFSMAALASAALAGAGALSASAAYRDNIVAYGGGGYSTSRDVTVSLPGYVPQTDDVIVVWPTAMVNNAVCTTPATWTNPRGGNVTNVATGVTMACVWRPVTAGEVSGGTNTFTLTNFWNATQTGEYIAFAARYIDSVFPIEALALSSSTSAVHGIAAIAATGIRFPADLQVCTTAGAASGTYSSPTSGFTLLHQSSVNQMRSLFRRNALLPVQVATSGGSVTASVSTTWVSYTIAMVQDFPGTYSTGPLSGDGTLSATAYKVGAVNIAGYAAIAGTSITLPAHNVGDGIVIFAFTDGSTTPATKPAAGGTVPAWADIDAPTGANTCSSRTAAFTATATNHTSGVWTGATGLAAVVLANVDQGMLVGGHSEGGATAGGSAAAPALTLTRTDGTSAILAFFGHRNATAWSAATAGYIRLASAATEVCIDAKGDTSTDGAVTQLCSGVLGGYRGALVEVLKSDSLRVPAFSGGGTLSATAAIWTPASIASLAAWFDPQQDLALGRFTDGQSITSYTSYDSSARVFTASAAPVFRASSINSKPRIEFTLDGMYVDGYNPGTAGLTFVMVTQASTVNNFQMMWTYHTPGNGYEMRYAGVAVQLQLVGDYSNGGPAGNSTWTGSLDTDYVFIGRMQTASPAKYNGYVNGTLVLDQNALTFMPNTAARLRIGFREDNYYFNGLVAEAMVFSEPISDTDMTNLMAYLRGKHGSLPAV